MPVYTAPRENIRFVLHDVLNVSQLAELPGYEEATPDMVDAIIEEAGKLCEEVLFPLNQSGDEEGCVYENGVVRTPEGFKEAYQAYIEGGWCGVKADPEYGGMGLPQIINVVMEELISSANMAFGMYPGLSMGAYDALYLHGTDELKQTYLPKLVEGTWSGTMCLTEPHCGTDLGLIRTKAEPADDDSYKITGTKIFISAGEHDLTENILHLVLAKLPDAPEGVRGISLFLVPKFIPKDDGTPGERNGVMCGSIEHKMGIHGNSTCVMNFDEATGWLVGQPHKGMKAMFTMMNMARLAVGMQGLGLAEVSYQNALLYAKERRQGRALTGAGEPDKPADSILVHPDVRKNLLYMKAVTEGSRALSYWTGMHEDIAKKHPEEDKRGEADDLVALMTPIIKAYQTDIGFDVANLGVQIFGGHGFIKEHGMEQYVRDARITQLYEGTNGIQALDLVGRKMGQNLGRLLRRFFHPVAAFIEEHREHELLAEFIPAFEKAFGKLQKASLVLAQKGMKNPDEAGAAATDYLRIFAVIAIGYMWLMMAKTAHEKLQAGEGDAKFYKSKIKTARFFFQRVLPEHYARHHALLAGAAAIMDLEEDEFLMAAHIPKAELHVHLEGTISPAKAIEIAARNNIDLPDGLVVDEIYAWEGFLAFLDTYTAAASILKSAEDYTDITQDYLIRSAEEGVIYTELHIATYHGTQAGLTPPQMINAIAQGIKTAKEKTGIEARLIMAAVRHCGVEDSINAAQVCRDHPHPLLTGFGMAGDENAGTVQDFKPAFDIACDAGGLQPTAHAGEAAGPESVIDCLDILGVKRIGHGVRAIEDSALVDRLARENITLEVCPSSNIEIGIYDSYEAHPLNKLKAAGVKITLNSDDPPFFHTTIGREYQIAQDIFGFTDEELLQCTRNAIDAAFVDEDTRQKLYARL